jgi:hypothetical protein
MDHFVRIAWEHPMFHISRKPDFAELKQVMVDIFKTDPQRTFVGEGTAGWDDMPRQTDLMIHIDLSDNSSPFPATIQINFLSKNLNPLVYLHTLAEICKALKCQGLRDYDDGFSSPNDYILIKGKKQYQKVIADFYNDTLEILEYL